MDSEEIQMPLLLDIEKCSLIEFYKLPAFSLGPVKSDIVLTYDGQLKNP